jgi:predicted  nucleic acid-binding Zn-ribbon protein
MSFSLNSSGELVQVVEQPVNEAEVQQQLQEELDAAQNEVNTHQANVSNLEQELAEIEAQADAKNAELEGHKSNLEAAQAKLQKSTDNHASLAAALALRNESVGAEPEAAASENSDEPAESEEVAVPVSVVAAEG